MSSLLPLDRNRIASLDFLRGVAILLVIFSHARIVPGFSPEGIDQGNALVSIIGKLSDFAFWRSVMTGWVGVDLFFVLSGYLIGGLLISELEERNRINFPRFWTRRAFKILPSYFVLILCLGLIPNSVYETLGQEGYWRSFWIHAFFLQNYLDPATFGPTWSLAIEEHFYLCVPFFLTAVYLYAKRKGTSPMRSLLFWALGMMLAALCFRFWDVIDGQWHEFALFRTHWRFDALFLGVFCQYLVRTRPDTLTWVNKLGLWLWPIVLALLGIALAYSRSHWLLVVFGVLGVQLAAALVLLRFSLKPRPHLERLWPYQWMAHIGRWSYNIYLWHFFIFDMNLLGVNSLALWIGEAVSQPLLRFWLLFALLVGASVGVGYIATVLVERPFLWLRKKIAPPSKRRLHEHFGVVETQPSKTK